MTCDAKVVGSKAAGRNGRSISRAPRFTVSLLILSLTGAKRSQRRQALAEHRAASLTKTANYADLSSNSSISCFCIMGGSVNETFD